MHKGFTLIEFVVIISIFAIMAAVALFNFQGFNSNVAISNLSHDIALTLRQAQVFGWSAQTATTGSTLIPQIDPNDPTKLLHYADGVYFPYDTSTSSFKNQFILYTKTDPTTGNEMYIPSNPPIPGDIINDTMKIQGNVHIVGIREGDYNALQLNNGNVPNTGDPAIESVSIAFSRPRPEAIFFPAEFGQNVTGQYIAIYIASTNNTNSRHVDHTILVSRFGEIEVQ